jgi:hypothetical protein
MKRKHNLLGLSSNPLFAVIVIAITLFLILIVTYLPFLHYITPSEIGNFNYSKSDLGTLGDLIGGILNPLLTFITIGLLIWSIRIQGKELKEATEQSRRSADALVQTNNFHNNNLEEQRRIVMIPHLMEKLKKESSFLYKTYREKSSIEIPDISKTQHDDKNISKIDIPSLGMLVVTGHHLNKIEIENILSTLNLSEQKDEVLQKLRLKLSICIQSIFEISNVCKMLKEIDAPTILYEEEINQARFLNLKLNEITKDMVSLGMQSLHFEVNLSEAHNHIESPGLTVFNHSDEGKPFMFVAIE